MKKIVFIVLSMVALTFSILFVGLSYRASQVRKVERIMWRVTDQVVSELDDESLVRQLFMFYLRLDDEKSLKELMPGSIFIHTRNIPTFENGEANLSLLNAEIENINNVYRQKNLPRPFYAIDQEGGRIRRIRSGTTDFPSAMAVAEAYTHTGQKDLPMLTGFYTCMELRQHGIQWNLTPVVDVQVNPDNPVIGTRSFGSDPKLVAEMAGQYVKGLQSARCMSSVKHFPGHGDTTKDSHFDLPYIDKTIEEMNNVELYPYTTLFGAKQQPYGLMSAHIIFNKVSPEPATLSGAWLTDKLRTQWGFQGIIITDDLAMNAMNIYQKREKIENLAVKAFLAGADVLLYSFKTGETQAMLGGFIEAHKKNIISKKRIVESARRIIYRKISLGLMDLYIKEHMAKWSPELQQESDLLLRRSNEIETNIKNIESQLAKVDSINQFISKNAIKTIAGKPESETDVGRYPLFTDVAESDPAYKSIKEKAVKLYSLRAFSENLCAEKCVLLHTTNLPLERILAGQKTKPWIVYTTQNPYPANVFSRYLSPADILVSSFSDTPTSRAKLIETWMENKMPPKSSVAWER